MEKQPDYKKMYLSLFANVSDTIAWLENSPQTIQSLTSRRMLVDALNHCEDIYLKSTDPINNVIYPAFNPSNSIRRNS